MKRVTTITPCPACGFPPIAFFALSAANNPYRLPFTPQLSLHVLRITVGKRTRIPHHIIYSDILALSSYLLALPSHLSAATSFSAVLVYILSDRHLWLVSTYHPQSSVAPDPLPSKPRDIRIQTQFLEAAILFVRSISGHQSYQTRAEPIRSKLPLSPWKY